ncbi:site-specific DNA-methyltransferase [Desulfovibrio sp. JY]|nr:site-specific DNA-methyltransferase [Desulfovibrio sp. JY]
MDHHKTIFDNGILYNGDALAVLRDLPDASVDAILTDPPYSSGGLHAGARRKEPAQKYQSAGTKRTYPPMLGDLKDQRSFVMWATLWLSQCWRLAKPGAPVMVFSDWRQLPAMTDAIQAAGFEWRGIVVWHKPSARPMLGSFRRDAEFVVHAVKAPAQAFTRRCFPGVFAHRVNPAAKVHLTSKPVDLLVDLLQVTPEGGVILDPFMGGGTTAVACQKTGRRFVGVELSREYYERIAERIRAMAELARARA